MPRGIDGKIAVEEQTFFAGDWIVAPDEEGIKPTNEDLFATEDKAADPRYPMEGFYLQSMPAASLQYIHRVPSSWTSVRTRMATEGYNDWWKAGSGTNITALGEIGKRP